MISKFANFLCLYILNISNTFKEVTNKSCKKKKGLSKMVKSIVLKDSTPGRAPQKKYID